MVSVVSWVHWCPLLGAWRQFRWRILQRRRPEADVFAHIKHISGDDCFAFQQDSAPAHRTKMTIEVIELLKKETPAFIDPSLWPPNSPDLNPVDYCVWGILQERVYRNKYMSPYWRRKFVVNGWLWTATSSQMPSVNGDVDCAPACMLPADISNISGSKTSAWNWNNALDGTRNCFTASCIQSDNLS